MLDKIILPPSNPTNISTQSAWLKTEKLLGTKLPIDFYDFINMYGSGSLGNFYWIWNPYLSEFFERVQEVCEIERQLKEECSEYCIEGVYPVSPGFLPCACDDNGNYYGWLTKGEPDQWPVMAFEVRGDGLKTYDMNFTEYLCGVFTKQISPLASGYPEKTDYVFAKCV